MNTAPRSRLGLRTRRRALSFSRRIETEIVKFRLRKLAVTTADRVDHAGRLLNIKGIAEITNGRGIELTCEAL